MLRVIFMGTPEFALPALDAVHQNFQIVGVYTQPDKPVGRGLVLKASAVKLRALEYHLPVFQPAKLSLPGEYEKLQSLSPDVIVVVAYGQILKINVLELPRLGCINVHSSLLPKWRGAAPIQWALLNGDSQTGITTMRLVEKLDAGQILLQESLPILEEDTATDVHDKLATMGARLIVSTLTGLESGKLSGAAQDEGKVTYAQKITKEMGQLKMTEPAEVLERKIRALAPWPGTYVSLLKTRLSIKKARVHSLLNEKPGKLFEKAGTLMLATQKGCLELLLLQWEGKKEVTPAEFLNGLRGKKLSLPLTID
jgi:methionyl-tRNA formyltransferase